MEANIGVKNVRELNFVKLPASKEDKKCSFWTPDDREKFKRCEE